MTRSLPAVVVLALLLLPLTGIGCGDGITVTTTGGGGSGEGDASGPSGSTSKAAAAPGLWEPSPMHGREVRGPITYAFKPAPAGATPKEGGEVTFAILEDIDSFNPYLSSSVTASEVQDQLFPRLMDEEPDYYDGVPTFTPQIAESWTIAPDNLSIRFRLRGCAWSDGTPITAEDVKFSVEAAQSPEVSWRGRSIVDFILKVEIHGPREFTVHYTQAQPYNIMDINDVTIVPKHTFGTVPFGKWQGHGGWPELARMASGGPWVLARHEPGQRIVLEPNPRYWDAPKPYLARLTFLRFGNLNAMLNALLSGQLDVMTAVIPEKASRVLEAEHLNLYTYVTRSYGYLGYNCRRWPFDDKRVRQAMTYAINRQDIVESIFAGYARVAGPAVIRSLWASNQSIEPYPHDPDKALALLAEAGWTRNGDGWQEKDGQILAFKLKTNQGNSVRQRICEVAQANLKEIGVKAEIAVTDFNQMTEQLKRHNFDAYAGGWYVATKVDPKPTFHSVSTQDSSNYVNFVNAEADILIDQGRVMDILDPAVRREAKKVWDRFQEILHDEQPYTMIYEPRGLVGVHARFVNVRVTSLRAIGNIHEWWVE